MTTYLANAFSLAMWGDFDHLRIDVRRLSVEEARVLAAEARSVVGHESTAALFSRALGQKVAVWRETLRLAPGDRLLVGQYVGPRLVEGATTLPEGAEIRWLRVESEERS